MKRFLLAVVTAVILFTTARAEARPGLRLGLTDQPDSVFFGFFYEAPVARLGRSRTYLTVEPGIDALVGISGYDFFGVRGTFNAKFVFPVGRNVQLYPLFGVSVVYINPDPGRSHTEAGLNLGLGMQFDRFAIELWGGWSDIPDITFLFSFSI